jgi:hypothetical protein
VSPRSGLAAAVTITSVKRTQRRRRNVIGTPYR